MVTASGTYCAKSTTRTGTTIGQVCASITPVAGTWSKPEPGVGLDADGKRKVRAEWTVAVRPAFASRCGEVGTKPYVKVFHGDVSSGSYLSYDGTQVTCPAFPGSSVNTYNREASGGYTGSGVADGLVAAGNVNGFRSASGSTTLSQKGLTFANNTASNFGGDYGSHSIGCSPDLELEEDISSLTNRVTQKRTSGFISTPTAITGNRTYVYKGDLFIDTPLIYSTAMYTKIESLPMLKIIVLGNIYIKGSVNQLDGVYMALETSTGGGNIFTCAEQVNGVVGAIRREQRAALCNTKLTVNGAISAKSIKLHRTIGTLRSSTAGETPATTNAAEVFDYGPSVWLPRRVTESSVQSITGMPPIL
jgi:hypothetical protein